MNRPLLLIDVDGVISLFGFDPAQRPPGSFEIVDGIAHLISVEAGEHLRCLCDAFEPTWCTGWEEKANEYLIGCLGLPAPWPYLSFGGAERHASGHWKLAAIDRYVGTERSVAWIDDAHDERCSAWATSRPAPTLLVTTDPATGVREEHVAMLLEWAQAAPGAS